MVNHPFHLVLATALTFTVTAPQTIAAGVDDLSFSPTPEETLVSLKFPQAGDRGTTQTSGGGGTRGGSCFTQANTNLRIVAPSQDTFTATANPSLFVYVPANRGVEGEFVLVDGAGELIHSQTVAVPEGETILAIAVPTEITLAPGGEYAWAFAVNCTIDNQVVGSAVEAGLVRRELSVEVTEEIAETNEPLSKATIYANQGIWQDTLMIVASLSEQRQELVELLGSVGLDQFSDVPIIFVGTDEAGDVPLAN